MKYAAIDVTHFFSVMSCKTHHSLNNSFYKFKFNNLFLPFSIFSIVDHAMPQVNNVTLIKLNLNVDAN